MKKNKTILVRVDTSSPQSGTATLVQMFPIAKFVLPRFKFMKKTAPIYFYTMQEVKKFLKKLPKDWRTFISLT